MGIAEKMANAKTTKWVSDGFSDDEVKSMVELAKISACIERCRVNMGMTQQEFANYMGVTQGMVSKWESREYNFTVRTLNEIGLKLGLELSVNLEKPCTKTEYDMLRWNPENNISRRKNGWMVFSPNKEAIA